MSKPLTNEELDALREPSGGMNKTLNIRDFDKLLAKITYKPNYEFELIAIDDWRLQLHIAAKVIDSTDQSRTTRLMHSSSMPLDRYFTEADFYAFVRDSIIKMELHEVDEFLQWADTGKPLNDPHAIGTTK